MGELIHLDPAAEGIRTRQWAAQTVAEYYQRKDLEQVESEASRQLKQGASFERYANTRFIFL